MEGLSLFQIATYMLWSAAIMLALSWALLQSESSKDSPSDQEGAQQQTSEPKQSVSGKRSSASAVEEKIPRNTSSSSSSLSLSSTTWRRDLQNGADAPHVQFNHRVSVHPRESTAVRDINRADIGEDDRYEDDSVGSDEDEEFFDGEESASSSAHNAEALRVALDSSGPASPTEGEHAVMNKAQPTKLIVPLRGRSQSSYNNIDIAVTMMARRKGSADEISTDAVTGRVIFVQSGSKSTIDGDYAAGGNGSVGKTVGGLDGSNHGGVTGGAGSNKSSPAQTTEGTSSSNSSLPSPTLEMVDIDPKVVVIKGRLFKLSLRKSLTGVEKKSPVWKQRDFVLSGYYLSYLDSMKRRNEFDLRGCELSTMLAHKCGGLNVDLHAMTISSLNGNRHIVLGASSEAYRDQWADSLEAHLSKISRQEDLLDGEMEEARYKGVPTPLEQALLNPPPLGRRKRADTARDAISNLALAEIERMRDRQGSNASGQGGDGGNGNGSPAQPTRKM